VRVINVQVRRDKVRTCSFDRSCNGEAENQVVRARRSDGEEVDYMIGIADLVECVSQGVLVVGFGAMLKSIEVRAGGLPIRKDALYVCFTRMSLADILVRHTCYANRPKAGRGASRCPPRGLRANKVNSESRWWRIVTGGRRGGVYDTTP